MSAQVPPLVPPSTGPVAGAVNAVASAAVGAANVVASAATGVASAATGAVNAVSSAATGAVNAVSTATTNMFGAPNARNNAKKNNGANTRNFNSLIPLGNSPPPTNQNVKNNVGVANSPPTFQGGMFTPLNIFIGLVVVFTLAFTVFSSQIRRGYEYLTGSVKKTVGIEPRPDISAQVIPAQGVIREVTVPPSPPQNITPTQAASHQTFAQNIVEKVLPSGGKEVYNIAQNKFTFYDAEPLCKALGAELATYEQVKDAWGKGADWCNYGWVKGQMAIYPTQKNTYDKLQAGPADEQNACGTTGINGGYFENPEMLYGVNCYGKKPSQSAHDQKQLMEEGKIPKSPETLKVDQMMRDFKAQADSTYVKPFNDDKWSTS